MKRFEFTITIASEAENVKEAWDDAVFDLAMKPGSPPEDYTEEEVEEN